VGSDGSKEFVTWFDTQRSERCYWSMASDGVTRCLPSEDVASQNSSHSTFGDSACSVPVVLRDAACPPKYARRDISGASSCSSYRYAVHSIVGATGSSSYYQKSSSACTLQTLTAPNLAYTVGPELPPDGFAASDLQTDP
jgi:hypothetical protein